MFVLRKKKTVALIIILQFCALSSNGDILYTKDGEEVKGVIIQKNPKNVTIETISGSKTLLCSNIRNVFYDTAENNLFLLAEIARENKDFTKAYFLIERILKFNPESKKAQQELAALDPLVTENRDLKWVSEYERYQSSPNDPSKDSSILSENSSETEKVLKKYGLILSAEMDKIKVQEIVKDSRADRSGLEINDFLFDVNNKPVSYMGLFDVVEYLAGIKENNIPITVQREIRFWIQKDKNPGKSDLLRHAGFDIADSAGVIRVTTVSEDSAAFRQGLREGDRIISVNGEEVVSFPAQKVKKIFKNIDSNYANLYVVKNFTI